MDYIARFKGVKKVLSKLMRKFVSVLFCMLHLAPI